jgi:hypothetical protein
MMGLESDSLFLNDEDIFTSSINEEPRLGQPNPSESVFSRRSSEDDTSLSKQLSSDNLNLMVGSSFARGGDEVQPGGYDRDWGGGSNELGSGGLGEPTRSDSPETLLWGMNAQDGQQPDSSGKFPSDMGSQQQQNMGGDKSGGGKARGNGRSRGKDRPSPTQNPSNLENSAGGVGGGPPGWFGGRTTSSDDLSGSTGAGGWGGNMSAPMRDDSMGSMRSIDSGVDGGAHMHGRMIPGGAQNVQAMQRPGGVGGMPPHPSQMRDPHSHSFQGSGPGGLPMSGGGMGIPGQASSQGMSGFGGMGPQASTSQPMGGQHPHQHHQQLQHQQQQQLQQQHGGPGGMGVMQHSSQMPHASLQQQQQQQQHLQQQQLQQHGPPGQSSQMHAANRAQLMPDHQDRMRGMLPHQGSQMKQGPPTGQMQHHSQHMQQHPQLGGGPPGGGMSRQPGQQPGMQMHPSMHSGGPTGHVSHGQGGMAPAQMQGGPPQHVQHQSPPVGVGGAGHPLAHGQTSVAPPGQLLHHNSQGRIPGPGPGPLAGQGHPGVGSQGGPSPMSSSVGGRDMGGSAAPMQAPIHSGSTTGVVGLSTISQKLTTCQTRMTEAMQV